MKCIVTGGTGFIGSNVAMELDKLGHEVVVLCTSTPGDMKNLEGFKGTVKKVDVSRPFIYEEEVDAIFHQAAITDPRFSDDKEMIRSNLEGFKIILDLAKKKNAKLIYASSANIYGVGPSPQVEDQPKDIMMAYGQAKVIMDEMASHNFKEMHIVGLRYFNVFGPRETHKGRPASMIYHLSRQIKEGKNPRIFIDGEQRRDHIYVKDVVKANLLALQAPSGVYNVGTGVGTSFNEIVEYLNIALGTDLRPEYIENPYKKETYQEHTQADTTRAEKYLKFKTRWSVLDGIKDYMKFLYG